MAWSCFYTIWAIPVERPCISTGVEPEEESFHASFAYTILFALIVLAAIATWVVPAGVYNLNALGEPLPGASRGSVASGAHSS